MNDPYGLGNSNPGNGSPYGGYAPPPPQGQPGYGQPNYGQPNYGQPNHGQPNYGNYGQPNYGPDQGFAGHAPPPPGPQGYVSYGQGTAPPSIYTPAGMPADYELRKLGDDAQLWLIVAAAGFWFGFGWITGPLAWYNGSQIRGKYRALGHHPCSSANWARGLGIASTAIYGAGVMFVILAVLVAIGAVIV